MKGEDEDSRHKHNNLTAMHESPSPTREGNDEHRGHRGYSIILQPIFIYMPYLL